MRQPLYYFCAFFGVFLFPFFSEAQTAAYLTSFVAQSQSLIGLLMIIVVSIGLVLFMWGLSLFILKADDEKERAIGRQRMIWGVVILTVLFSIWGIVSLLTTIFGTNEDDSYNAPKIINPIS